MITKNMTDFGLNQQNLEFPKCKCLILSSDPKLSKIFKQKPTVAYRKNKSLSDHLLKNDIANQQLHSNVAPCGKLNPRVFLFCFFVVFFTFLHQLLYQLTMLMSKLFYRISNKISRDENNVDHSHENIYYINNNI